MSNFPNCIIRTAKTNQLASETHIDPIIVTAKIAAWQADNNRIGEMPSIEEFKEYLSTQKQNYTPSYTIQDALGNGRNLQIVRGNSDDADVTSSKTGSQEGGAIITLPKEPVSIDRLMADLEGTKTMMKLDREGFTLDKLRGIILTDEDAEEFLIMREISKLKNSNDDPVRDIRFAWAQMVLMKTDFDSSEAEGVLTEGLKEGLIKYAPKGKDPQEYLLREDSHGQWHIYNRQGEEVFKTKDGKSNKNRRLIFGHLGMQEGRTKLVEIGEDSYLVNNDGKILNMQTGKVISQHVSNPLTRQIRAKAFKLFNPNADDMEYVEEDGFKWAQRSDNNFEVSSQGTPLGREFSAFNAKFAEGTEIDGENVSGKPIEIVYQNVIKKSGKGQAPGKNSKLNLDNIKNNEESIESIRAHNTKLADKIVNGEDLTKEDLEDVSYILGYLPLWQTWAEQHSDLMDKLKKVARGKTLTDKFADTRVSQARALAEILNNQKSVKRKWAKRKPLPESATEWHTMREGSGYRNRTIANAEWADITISFAPVTWSPGEVLTKVAAEHAGKGFMFFNPFESMDHSYDGYQIKSELEAMGLNTSSIKLNIAGNSLNTINTWEKKKAEKNGTEPHIYTQEEYDGALQAILQSMLDAGITVEEVRTGGQTGADLAGSNAAYSLGIKNSVLAPKGWGFQTADGTETWGDYDAFTKRFKSWQDAHKDDDPATKKWTRESIQNDPESLYIFTDNTDRDSGSNLIDPNSKYAQKYGKDKHYPTMTTAIARGLDNAMPISTQRWYHKDAQGITGRWQDADAEEFENTISEEVDAIIEEWNTGAYKQVKIPSGDGLFNAKISDISNKRVPKLYQILQAQYKRLEDTIGKDNIIGPVNSKSKAMLTLGQSDKYNALVEQQDGIQKNEKMDGIVINQALDALNKKAANYQSTTEGMSDVDVEVSPSVKLAMEFSPQERATRVDFLARRFSEIVDGLIDERRNSVEEEVNQAKIAMLKSDDDDQLRQRYNELAREQRILNDDIKGRRNIIQSTVHNGFVGLDAIFNMMKESIEEFRDSEADRPDLVAKYNKMLDNFDQLIKDACKSLESIEGFQVIPIKNKVAVGDKLTAESITDDGSEKTAEEKAAEEEQFADDETGTSVASGNDGWSFKIRFVDPRTSLSKGVKKVLNSLIDVDYNGEMRTDDLGFPRYRNGEQSHAILLNELSDMIDSDDFYNPDADGYDRYPALNRISERYPWVTQVMNALDENPELVGSFFSDFNKSFISYWKHDDKGNPMPLNDTVARDAAMQGFIRNYEHAVQLDKTAKSIYTTGGKIYMPAVQEAQAIVKELMHNEHKLDVEDLEDEVKNLSKALRMMGLEAQDDRVDKLLKSLILDAEDEINDDLDKLLSNMHSILDGVQNKNKFTEDSHLIDTFRYEFGEIARIAGEITELDNLMSFREGDKTRYSYSAPNYAINLVKQFKSDKRRAEFMQKEFADYPWFMQNGEYLAPWLEMLGGSNMNSDIIRDKLHLKEVISIGSKDKTREYSDWSSHDVRNVLINEYFSQGYNPKSRTQFAYYNFPIFADSPVAMFIRMPRFTNDFKGQLLPMYRKVVKQELIRINQVIERHKKMEQLIAEGNISEAAAMEIQNFDKNGSKFCFFPELNKEEVNGKPFKKAAQELLDNHDISALDALIDSTIESVLDRLFNDFMKDVDLSSQVKNFIKKDIIVDEKNDTLNTAYAKEKLEEYFWNSTFAASQIVEITTTDLAFYKNGTDFQKRFKEVYAAGNRLNTNTTYGRKTERYLILKDQLITSSNYININQSLNEAVKEGRMTSAHAQAIANKFKEVNVADAQALRNPYSFRAVLDMMGAWTKDMEESFNRFQKGTWNKVDFDIVWQTLKPFVFTNIHKEDGVGGAIRSPHQNKNSEFLVLAAYSMVAASTKNSEFLKGIGKFFEAHRDIDLIQFESAVKAGGQGKINLNYSDERVSRILHGKNAKSYTETVDGKSISYKPFLEWFDVQNLEEIADELLKQENQTAWKGKSEEEIQSKLSGYSDYDKLKIALDYLLEEGDLKQRAYNIITKEIEPSEDEIMEILEECIKDPETGTTNIEDGIFNHNVVHEVPYSDYMIAQPTPEHLIDVDEATAGSQFRNLVTANLPDDFTMTLPGSNRVLTKSEVLRLYRAAITDQLLDSYEGATEVFSSIDNLRDRLLKLIQDNPKYGDDLVEALEIVEVTNPITGEKQRVFNLPLDVPSITNQIQELVTSTFKNKVTKQKIKGGNAILTANVGLTRELNVLRDPKTNNVTGVECYLPAWSKKFFKEFTSTWSETDPITGKKTIYEEVDIERMQEECPDLLKMIGYRIPTEDKYSMLPLVVKGFLPQQNGSSIMVAADVTTIAGSDFDVDKMFLRIPAFNKKTLKKIEYSINETGDIAEATRNMSKEQRDNLMIDLEYGILTSKTGSEQMFNPGTFDTAKKMSRISDITNDIELLNSWAASHDLSLDNIKAIYDSFHNAKLEDLNDFLKGNSKEINPLTPQAFVYYHSQNMVGNALVGIYANGSSVHTKMQDVSLNIIDSETFQINGRTIKHLDAVNNGLGESIQHNIAEFQNASVDNVKDPVLAKLGQYTNTADTMLFMLRAGLSIEEACLLFKNPLSSISSKQMLGIFKRLGKSYQFKIEPDPLTNESMTAAAVNNTLYKDFFDRLRFIGHTRLSNEEFERAMFDLYDTIDNNPSLKANLASVINSVIEPMKVFEKCTELTARLKQGNSILKADSPNNAIDTSIAGAIRQERMVQLFEANSDNKKNFPFEGSTEHVSDEFIKNRIITADMDKEQMRKALLEQKLPSIQAFYSLGIELPIYVMDKFFIHGDKNLREGLKFLMDNANGGIMDAAEIKEFFNGYIKYALSKTEFFGKDFDTQRSYYLHTFPQRFMKEIESNPDLISNPTISRLSHNLKVGTKNYNAIEFKRGGKTTPLMKSTIRRDFNHLVFNGNTVQFAKDLFCYAYYHDGFVFGPNSFGYFLDATYWSRFPEVANAVRNMRANITSDDVSKYIEMFLANNPSVVKFANVDKKYEGASQIKFSEDEKGMVINPYTKYGYNDYINTRYGLFRLDSTTADGDPVYNKIPTFNSQVPVYNANSTVEEMSKLYYTEEGDESNVVVKYTDETIEDAPSQSDLIERNGQKEEEEEGEDKNEANILEVMRGGTGDLEQEEVDQEKFYNEIQNKLNTINNNDLRSTTANRLGALIDEHQESGETFKVLLPKLYALVDEAITEDKGECQMPNKKHRYR